MHFFEKIKANSDKAIHFCNTIFDDAFYKGEKLKNCISIIIINLYDSYLHIVSRGEKQGM